MHCSVATVYNVYEAILNMLNRLRTCTCHVAVIMAMTKIVTCVSLCKMVRKTSFNKHLPWIVQEHCLNSLVSWWC